MKPTHKPVCSCENGEYSAMALGFTSGFDQKMSEPRVYKYFVNALEYQLSMLAGKLMLKDEDPISTIDLHLYL